MIKLLTVFILIFILFAIVLLSFLLLILWIDKISEIIYIIFEIIYVIIIYIMKIIFYTLMLFLMVIGASFTYEVYILHYLAIDIFMSLKMFKYYIYRYGICLLIIYKINNYIPFMFIYGLLITKWKFIEIYEKCANLYTKIKIKCYSNIFLRILFIIISIILGLIFFIVCFLIVSFLFAKTVYAATPDWDLFIPQARSPSPWNSDFSDFFETTIYSDVEATESTSKSVPLVYQDTNKMTIKKIYVDHDKLKPIKIPDIDQYYDPHLNVWWDAKNKEWKDSTVLYGKHTKYCYMIDPLITQRRDNVSSLGINRIMYKLDFPDDVKEKLNLINKWYIQHLNAENFFKYPFRDMSYITLEDKKEFLKTVDSTRLRSYSYRLFIDPDIPNSWYSYVVNELDLITYERDVDETTKINIKNFIKELLAQRARNRIIYDDIGQKLLLLTDTEEYKYISHIKFHVNENKKWIKVEIPTL